MNREEILSLIRSLANSQGRWGRLYESFMEAKETDPVIYEEYMSHLEEQNFQDPTDAIEYLEHQMGYC